MWKLLLVIIEIFVLIMERIFTQKVLHRKHPDCVMEILTWSGYFALSNYITYSFSKYAWQNTLIFAVTFFMTLRILYKDTIGTLTAVTAFMAIGGVLSEFITYYGWILLTQKNTFQIDNTNQNYLLIIISKLVFFLFIKLLLLIIQERKDSELNMQDWIEIFMIPGGSIVILTVLFNRTYTLNGILDFAAVIMIMLINIFTYYLYDQIRKRTEERTREAILQEQSEYYIRQYRESQKMWLELSEFRHNVRERYLMERMYLEQKNYAALASCYQNTLELLQGHKKAANTGNLYFDSIINYKAGMAARENIDLQTELSIPGDIEVNVEDMYICLGNLLDNAIEAAKHVQQEKHIHLKIVVDTKNLFITVSNNYEGTRNKTGTGYLTTKQNREKHGLGLNIVKKIAGRYDGEVVIEDENSKFTVTVLLYGIID